MKVIYVAHPFRGDEIGNAGKVARICRQLHKDYPDYLFVSPIHAFSWFRDDHEGALEHCLRMLARCDELWLFGEWQNSAGCMMERDAARNLGIEIFAPIRLEVNNMLAYSIRCNLEDLENRKADIEAEIKMVQLRHDIEWLEKVLNVMKAMEAEGELGCCRVGTLGASQDTPKGPEAEQ